jgi:hypothetical protein
MKLIGKTANRDTTSDDEHGLDRRRDRPERTGRDEPRPVVTDQDIRVLTKGEDFGVYRAHRRFGGIDAGAAISGLLAATGMAALLGALAGAVGTIGYQLDAPSDAEAVTVGSFIAGLVVLVLSFLVGGWVAGRVARYDGGINGLVTAIAFFALSAVMAGLGAWLGDEYDVFTDLRLPQWFNESATTVTAVLSAIVVLAVSLAAGWLGGVAGSHWHHRVDRYLAEHAQGGKPVSTETLLRD